VRALWLTKEWQSELEALEALATYPLGNDSFRISHGRDYFAFFERMGEVKMRALVDDDAPPGERIVAMACGILRAGPAQKHWYLCDAKVRPSHRGQRLLIKLVRDVFLPNYARAPRGYFVAMNPSDGRPPLSVRLTDHFAFIPRALISSLQLEIFSTDFASAPRDVRWISLSGVKDLVLSSTNVAMPLLHATRSSEGGPPREGHVHMWCAPAGANQQERGVAPMATATVVHHRMGSFDGGLIETHEI
jgi:hypothetical protein